MLKTAPLLLAATLLCFASTGCEQKKSAAELKAVQDKIKREEKRQRAATYYQDLITKYPDSEFAEEAKKRLQSLGPVGTPGAKPPQK
jgi:TolA-binding protein